MADELRTGVGDVAITVAPFTTDGDLALDPSQLEDHPELERAMRDAGFELARQEGGHIDPGKWVAWTSADGKDIEVPIDLIVPDAVAGPGSRAARLGVHGKEAARRAVGLEAALIDHSEITITALEPGDDRSIVTNVAGVAALLVAKLHKVHDRVASGKDHRQDDKDAADVIRIMQTTSPEELGATLRELARDDVAGPVASAAVDYLRELFGRRGAVGVQMAARALEFGMPAERVEALALAYADTLLTAIGR